jgi:hypothetical protein
MICHSIDNISYARELYTHNIRQKSRGEYVINRDTIDTIIGLFCTGHIPETLDVKIIDNKCELTIYNTKGFIFEDLINIRRLASYSISKDFKYKFRKKNILISNINIIAILKLISSGTTYGEIIQKENEYILIR